jgi:hypothetical protein
LLLNLTNMNEEQRQTQRRKRLAAWLEQAGGPHAAALAASAPQSVETQISRVLGGYVFGERAARSLELRLNIPVGHLDDFLDQALAVKPAKTLSASGFELGELLDLIPDRLIRAEAYSAALREILSRLRKSEQSTTD